MAQRIILADTQAIFRAGAARILAVEEDFRIVAQCIDLQHLQDAVRTFRSSITIFSASITSDLGSLLDAIETADSKCVIIAEHGESLDETLADRVDGVVLRSVAGPQLVECVRRVAAGERSIQRVELKPASLLDRAGLRALKRLTPKELQVVALVVQGGKNKEIGDRLGTGEQVIKNHLRSIYGKMGVSDRLELAVFTQRHRVFADAAAQTLLATA